MATPLPDLPRPAAPAAATASARPARRRWTAWLGIGLLGLVLLLVLLVLLGGGALYGLLRHPDALPWVLQQVPGLRVQGLQGTLGSGRLRAQSLVWQMPANAGQLSVQGLLIDSQGVDWSPHPGARIGLRLARVEVDSVVYQSGPPSGVALAAPADLRLPLALQIDALRIGRLQIDALPVIETLAARVALGAERGALHRIEALSLDWQQVHFQGSLQIGSTAPLALQASLQARRSAGPAWAASLQARGPLAKLVLDARLQGQAPPSRAGTGTPSAAAPSLAAHATVLPFAPWPLGELTLATHQLDLSALAPGLPHTALSGNATVLTRGPDQPATADIKLINALPGAWDTGRLPVRQWQLRASGAPRQHDELTLEHFTLDLADASGPAGQVSGKGRWAADALALELQVSALQPARLHQQAAALLLAGPVQLRATGLPGPAAASVAGSATAAPPATPPATSRAGTPTPAPAKLPQLAVDAKLNGRLLDGSGLPVQLRLVGQASQQHILISQMQASAGAASAKAQLDALAVGAGWQLRGQASLDRFDPRPWWRGTDASAWQKGPQRLDGELDLDLLWRRSAAPAAAQAGTLAIERWLSQIDGDARLAVRNSLLAGVPLAGTLRLHSGAVGTEIEASADLAGNQLSLKGQRAAQAAADEWQVQLQAPALAALAPLARLTAELAPGLGPLLRNYWPSTGKLAGELQVSGRWPTLRTRGELRAAGLLAEAAALQSATLGWQTGANADAPLTLKLQAQGLASGPQRLDSLSASLTGSLRQHSLMLRADSPAKPPSWTENLLGPVASGTRLQIDGQGRWQPEAGRATADDFAGRWLLQGLQLQGGARDSQGGSQPWLSAQALSAELALGTGLQLQAVSLAPGRVQLLGTTVNWQEARWQAGPGQPAGQPAEQSTTTGPGRLTLVAELERFDVAALLARLQPDLGWGGQLTVGGRIDIRRAAKLDAEVVLERVSGDLTLTDDLGVTQALGVTDLRLALTAHDGLWQFAQGLAGRSIGEMAGAQVLRTSADRLWPPADAALQGVIESRVANLGIWGAWVPPGWRLTGNLRTSAIFGGTLGAPEVRGEMVGSGLGVRNLLQGVNFADGDLALTLAGDSARIERFVFKGGDGQLTLTGGAQLGAAPSAKVHLVADRFRLLGRIDRRLVASGSADLQLDAQRLVLDGGFTVDEGLIDLSQSEARALDADVVVRRSSPAASAPGQRAPPLPGLAAAAPTPQRQAQVTLKINLGQKLRLRGHGVDTGLRGDLVVSSPDGKLALRGVVRTEGGTVAAYGQKLEIERGAVSFAGALDNPQLDVLAIRPNLDVRVGVLVIGPAQNPRIRLFSEPDLADYDKLSWLVLGRAPDGLGRNDTALLQRAALALLSGDGKSPTDALLEGIGLTDFSVRQSDGDTRETIVSLGKQLSQRWYIGYERSVNATTGSWQLIYRIAQRFTLRAQSGTDNALDVIWSWRW